MWAVLCVHPSMDVMTLAKTGLSIQTCLCVFVCVPPSVHSFCVCVSVCVCLLFTVSLPALADPCSGNNRVCCLSDSWLLCDRVSPKHFEFLLQSNILSTCRHTAADTQLQSWFPARVFCLYSHILTIVVSNVHCFHSFSCFHNIYSPERLSVYKNILSHNVEASYSPGWRKKINSMFYCKDKK